MALFFSLLVAIILVASSEANPLSSELHYKSADYRLPEDVIPVSYKMLFTPEFGDKLIFHGESEIVIYVIAKTNKIVLHANDLIIKTVTLTGLDSRSIIATPAALNTKNDFLVINLDTELVPKTNYTLKFIFEGKLNVDGNGFFLTLHVNDNGQLRWSAATHFEPTAARRAFPCWDEPHLKATFDISIKHHKDLNAISNMHAIATEVDPTDSTQKVTIFATTPKMSTYIVAFIITDYESLSNEDGSFKVWAPSKIQRGKFFVKFVHRMLEELETYTGISYASHGFKKIDAVAIFPSRTFATAMENWGLITFRESLLPVAENSSTINGASTLIHEFAHQWFGNLVSPKWWKYLWLSEGFATYVTNIITDKVWPEWRIKDYQIVKTLRRAFSVDSGNTAQALNHDVYSPTEIKTKFTKISYDKAASVIRMIAHVLGEEKFQIALKKYLNKMKFKAATSDDLFEEFVKVFPTLTGLSAQPIDILNNWANTPGCPLITITRDYERNTAIITQERLLNTPDPAHTETYYVPINYATQEDKNFDDTTVTSWIDKDKQITEIEGNFKKNQWIIFNKQHFGYYRVNYDEQNWKMISDFLQSKSYTDVHVINRAMLVNDAMSLALNGQLRWDIALNVFQFLKQEVHPVPWYSVFDGFWSLLRLLANTDFDRSFKNYVLKLVENVLKNVTLTESPEDNDVTKRFRGEVVTLACALGSKSCRNEALVKVTNWLNDPERNMLPFAMKEILLCAGVRNADQATWDKLLKKYLAGDANYPAEVLACTSNAESLTKYLFEAMVEFPYYFNFPNAVRAAIKEDVNGVLDFVITNANRISAVSPSHRLYNYINLIGNAINTEAQLEKLVNASSTDVQSVSANAIRKARKRLNSFNLRRNEFTRFFNKTL